MLMRMMLMRLAGEARATAFCSSLKGELEEARSKGDALRAELSEGHDRVMELEGEGERLRSEVDKARDESKAASQQLQVALMACSPLS